MTRMVADLPMTSRPRSAAGRPDGAPDALLLARLGRAAWQALPALATLGLACLLGLYTIARLLGPAAALTLPVLAVALGPMVAWAIHAVHRGLFAVSGPIPGAARRALAITGAAGGCGALAVLNAELLAGASSAPVAVTIALAVALAASVAATVVAVLAASAALPLALMRPEIRLRTIALGALLTIARRPWGALAAALVPAAIAWLGVSWFLGLLVAVAPVYVVLAVAATWTSVAAAGIAVPDAAGTSYSISPGGRPTLTR